LSPGRAEKDQPTTNLHGKLAVMFFVSTIAANPIAGLLILVELLIFGAVAFLIGGPPVLFRAILATQQIEATRHFS